MDKKSTRLRRARKTRVRIAQLRVARLAVHRSNGNIYAQVFSSDGTRVLASASTLDASIRGGLSSCGNVSAAAVVGKVVAERALAAGITDVAFDRSGFHYHGRVKALADAAREGGLKF